MPTQRYQQVPTVDDEESVPPPRYSMPNGQTYYSGLPTSVPPQALEQTFVSVSDEKERSGQDESKSVGEDSGEEDLEAQKGELSSMPEPVSQAWKTFETAATLAFAVWFCGLITWVVVKHA